MSNDYWSAILRCPNCGHEYGRLESMNLPYQQCAKCHCPQKRFINVAITAKVNVIMGEDEHGSY